MLQHISYHGTSKALSLVVLFDAQNGKLAAYRRKRSKTRHTPRIAAYHAFYIDC